MYHCYITDVEYNFTLFIDILQDLAQLILTSIIKYYILCITKYIVYKGRDGREMNDKYEKQMKKGVLDMLVLKLLEPESKYGYQIIQEMKEKSEEVFQLKDGTLYPVLYRLEDDGLVVSEWSEAEGKQVPRKYYRITEDGKNAIVEIKNVWEKISHGIDRIMEG